MWLASDAAITCQIPTVFERKSAGPMTVLVDITLAAESLRRGGQSAWMPIRARRYNSSLRWRNGRRAVGQREQLGLARHRCGDRQPRHRVDLLQEVFEISTVA